MDLYSCYGGAPIILTSPHLSGRVTKSIVKEISGLTPDDSIYQTYLDLEPVSIFRVFTSSTNLVC